jgi:hypothetical protein
MDPIDHLTCSQNPCSQKARLRRLLCVSSSPNATTRIQSLIFIVLSFVSFCGHTPRVSGGAGSGEPSEIPVGGRPHSWGSATDLRQPPRLGTDPGQTPCRGIPEVCFAVRDRPSVGVLDWLDSPCCWRSRLGTDPVVEGGGDLAIDPRQAPRFATNAVGLIGLCGWGQTC